MGTLFDALQSDVRGREWLDGREAHEKTVVSDIDALRRALAEITRRDYTASHMREQYKKLDDRLQTLETRVDAMGRTIERLDAALLGVKR